MNNGALQLYDYMVANRRQVWEPKEGKASLVVIFQFTQDCSAYKPYLDQLKGERWIEGHQKEGKFILGYGVVTEHLYGKPAPTGARCEMLLSRYSNPERETVQRTLDSFGELKMSGQLTPLQTVKELEYFARFCTSSVVQSCQVYLSLHQDGNKYGPNYLRGIIRNEARKGEVEAPPIVDTPSRVVTPVLNKQKEKTKWIRSRIDMVEFSSLSPKQQEEYLKQLENEYQRSVESTT